MAKMARPARTKRIFGSIFVSLAGVANSDSKAANTASVVADKLLSSPKTKETPVAKILGVGDGVILGEGVGVGRGVGVGVGEASGEGVGVGVGDGVGNA